MSHSRTDKGIMGFYSLVDDLILHAASYLSSKDLVQLECVSPQIYHSLNTDELWRVTCNQTFGKRPRSYLRQVSSRMPGFKYGNQEGDTHDLKKHETFAKFSGKNSCGRSNGCMRPWKNMYRCLQDDLKRTEITWEELEELQWYFSFTVVAGGRRNDVPIPCRFSLEILRQHPRERPSLFPHLILEGYPPLPVELRNSKPPSVAVVGRSSERSYVDSLNGNNKEGDPIVLDNFSQRQWIQIASFPPHFITRMSCNGEWVIANENVIMFSQDNTIPQNKEDRDRNKQQECLLPTTELMDLSAAICEKLSSFHTVKLLTSN